MAPHTTMSDEDLELPELKYDTSPNSYWAPTAAKPVTAPITDPKSPVRASAAKPNPYWAPTVAKPVTVPVTDPKPPVKASATKLNSRKPIHKRASFYVSMSLVVLLGAALIFMIVAFAGMHGRAQQEGKFELVQVGHHNGTNATTSPISRRRNHPRFFPYPPIGNGSHPNPSALNGTYHHPHHPHHRPCHPKTNVSVPHYRRDGGHSRNDTSDKKGGALTLGLAGAAIGASHTSGASLLSPLVAVVIPLVIQVLFLLV